MAQFRGYVEVQKGSLAIEVDNSGLFVAVSCPQRPVGFMSQDQNKLAEAKEYLTKVQAQVDVFAIGTTELLAKNEMDMSIRGLNWSPDGRFLSVGSSSNTSSQKIVQVNGDLFERILSVKDACRIEKDFWRKRDFNLLLINKQMESMSFQ